MSRFHAMIFLVAMAVGGPSLAQQISEPEGQTEPPARITVGDNSDSPEFRITNERFEENIQLAIGRLVARTLSEMCFPCCFCCGPHGDCCDECNDKNLTAIPPSGD